jgi:Cu/Ag efflux protein CusF
MRRIPKISEGRQKMRMPVVAAVLGLFVTALPSPATAQSDDFVAGEITKIDQPASKITIKHGPLTKFGMDTGMTMVFRVPDPALLKNLKPGDKIKFVPDRVNNQFTVTKIQKEK